MLDDLRALSRQFIDLRNREYRRYFIKTKSLDHRFSIILGDRGVGKTTTLVQHLLQYVKGDHLSAKILYIQSDHILLGNMRLYDIADEFYKLGGEYLALDEIHKYPEWSLELKSIFDTFPNLKILASGSSALEIHKGTHDLSRRAIVYRMLGMSFREFLEIEVRQELPCFTLIDLLEHHERQADQIIKILKQQGEKVLSLFEKYLRHGYYPYYQEYPKPETFSLTLERNIHTTIEADLVAIHPELSGNSIKMIKKLMVLITQQVPFMPNWTKIKQVVDVKDNRTLKTYMKYLEDAAMIRSLSRASGKLSEVELVEKIFLSNTNQLYALNMESPEIGTVRETFFLSMLQSNHQVVAPKNADFKVDNKYLFEVGGNKKSFKQIRNIKDAYLALGSLEIGIGNKIPLWLFGFLY